MFPAGISIADGLSRSDLRRQRDKGESMFKELGLIFSLMAVASCYHEKSPANNQLSNEKNAKDLSPFFPEDLTLSKKLACNFYPLCSKSNTVSWSK